MCKRGLGWGEALVIFNKWIYKLCIRRYTAIEGISTPLRLGATSLSYCLFSASFTRNLSTKNTRRESHLFGSNKVYTMRLLHTVRKIPQEFAILLSSRTRFQTISPQNLFYTFLTTFHNKNAILDLACIQTFTNCPGRLIWTIGG